MENKYLHLICISFVIIFCILNIKIATGQCINQYSSPTYSSSYIDPCVSYEEHSYSGIILLQNGGYQIQITQRGSAFTTIPYEWVFKYSISVYNGAGYLLGTEYYQVPASSSPSNYTVNSNTYSGTAGLQFYVTPTIDLSPIGGDEECGVLVIGQRTPFTVCVNTSGSSIPPTTGSGPVINSFISSPPTVSPGQGSTLSWTASFPSGSIGNSVSIDGVATGLPSSGSRVVYPGSTQNYTLRVANSVSTVTKLVAVNVSVPPLNEPTIISFYGSPASVNAGIGTNLYWNVSFPSSDPLNKVSIDEVASSLSPSGNIPVTPSATKTYTLRAGNSAGAAVSLTTITVTQPANTRTLRFYNSVDRNPIYSVRKFLTESGSSVVKICVDGANATIVTYDNVTNADASNVSFRCVDASNIVVPGTLFAVNNTVTTSSYKEARFTHPINTALVPSGQQKATGYKIQAVINGSVVTEHPVEFYREPVLMVHGWAGAPSGFDAMQNSLTSSGQWPVQLTFKANFISTNGKKFDVNNSVIQTRIDSLINQSRNNSFSCGKIAVVAHSQGAALTRIYIGSSTYGSRLDVNRVVTIGGVNMGTQIGNFLLDQKKSFTTLGGYRINAGELIGNITKLPIYEGGLESMSVYQSDRPDLGVDVQNKLLTNTTNYGVPFHAISTFYDYALDYDITPELSLDWSIALLRIAGLYAGSALYNSEGSDLCVPQRSQTGGVERILSGTYYDLFQNIAHAGSQANSTVISRTKDLLNQNPSVGTGNFTNQGFANPDPALYYQSTPSAGYSYVPPTGTAASITASVSGSSASTTIAGNERSGSSISSNSTANYQSLQPGQTININVSASSNLTKIILIGVNSGNNDVFSIGPVSGSTYTFAYTAPNISSGVADLYFLAVNDNGLMAQTAMQIDIGSCTSVPTSLNLGNVVLSPASASVIYRASSTISTGSSGTFSVNPDAGVSLYAGNSISLKPGTSIYKGAYFNAAIQTNLTSTTPCSNARTRSDDLNNFNQKNSILSQSESENIIEIPQSIPSVSIYPNPSNGFFNVVCKQIDGAKFNILVTNLIGKKVLEKRDINSNEVQIINLSTAGKGLFILTLFNEKNIIKVEKLIVE